MPEVVLLDTGLPDADGYDACRRLRARRGGADLLTVAITGWGQAEDKERAFAAGFSVHMTKPVDLHRLHALLADHGAHSKAP